MQTFTREGNLTFCTGQMHSKLTNKLKT